MLKTGHWKLNNYLNNYYYEIAWISQSACRTGHVAKNTKGWLAIDPSDSELTI